VRVGSLRVAGISTRNLRVDVRAARGKVELNPLTADLYQGSVAGSLALEATTPPRLALRQKFTGISIGPLLKDAVGRQMIDGRGNVVLDVTSQGTTVAAIEKALAGSARIELRDGAVHGVNVAQAIRSAKALFGGASSGPQSGTASQAESTDFTELSASFAIAHGVAHNEDLQAKTPLLRVAGRGDVDLGESRLDYLVRATIVDTLKGQGAADLQALRGVTVPVRLKGPFASIGYSVDVADLAKDVATKKVEEALKAKVQDQLGEKLKGLFGR
jgi:AsmA protein